MKYITFINVLMRLFFIGMIFILINKSEDYIYIPLLNSLGGLIGGIFAIYVILIKEKVVIRWVKMVTISRYVKDAFPIFISIMSTQFYLNINKLVIGTFLGMSEVAVYDLGEKVTTLLKTPINMVNQAVFPKISIDKNLSFLNKVMWIVVTGAVLMYIVIFYASEYISVFFIGNNMSSNIIRILSLSVILFSFTSFLGGCRLLCWGLQKEYMKIMIGNCFFYAFAVAVLYSVDYVNIYSMSILSVLVELFCLILIVCVNIKLGVLEK